MSEDINRIIFEKIRATSVLVAILKHYGKLSVPRNIFKELLENEQVWPNDFITNNGSMMCVTYDEDSEEMGFELRYESDGERPKNSIGFQCTRGNPDVGFVDYNSPFYRK